MTALKKFRDHCRVMSQDGHTDTCVIEAAEADRRWGYFRMFREWRDDWGPRPSGPPRPCAGDCVSPADRDLFARMAAEVDDYLAPQPDLFGEMTVEPAANPTHTTEAHDAPEAS